MENKIYNVIIIGAGDIGSGYDSPNSENHLTHAHAFSDHIGFNLIGFVEPNIEIGKREALKWGVYHFSKIEDAFNKEIIDIVSIAAPDALHYMILKQLVNYKPAFVLTEKPLTLDLDEAREIIEIYKDIPAIVNFRRKFVPEINELKHKISNGYYGEFLFGNSYYGKGFKHNGCHLINLMFHLLNNKWSSFILEDEIFDYENNDPSYSLTLKDDNNSSFRIKAVDQNHFGIFEFDLFFKKGRIRIKDTGFKIEEFKVKKNQIFPTFKTIEKDSEYSTQLKNSLLLTVDHIYQFLTEKCELICTLNEVYFEMNFMNQIIKNSRDGKLSNIRRKLN